MQRDVRAPVRCLVIGLVALLVMGLALVLSPSPALASSQHSGGHSGGHSGDRSGGHHSGGFHHSRPFVRPFFPRPFVACCGAAVVVVPPLYGAYDYSSGYYPPTTSAYPPTYGGTYGANYAVAPPAPSASPMPTVVVYPGGRYELRGDGVNQPYVWVWIPNPPSGPPGATPPPQGSPDSPAPQTGIYHWTDERGVTTWTDRADKVPERYRTQPKQSKLINL